MFLQRVKVEMKTYAKLILFAESLPLLVIVLEEHSANGTFIDMIDNVSPHLIEASWIRCAGGRILRHNGQNK